MCRDDTLKVISGNKNIAQQQCATLDHFDNIKTPSEMLIYVESFRAREKLSVLISMSIGIDLEWFSVDKIY